MEQTSIPRSYGYISVAKLACSRNIPPQLLMNFVQGSEEKYSVKTIKRVKMVPERMIAELVGDFLDTRD